MSESERLLIGSPEAADILSISARLLWQETKDGNIPCIRIGRRVLYSVEALSEWSKRAADGHTKAKKDGQDGQHSA